jgi:hypothetical protein
LINWAWERSSSIKSTFNCFFFSIFSHPPKELLDGKILGFVNIRKKSLISKFKHTYIRLTGLVALISLLEVVFEGENWEICLSKMKKSNMTAFNIFLLSMTWGKNIEFRTPHPQLFPCKEQW